jgi:hypothetical protein
VINLVIALFWLVIGLCLFFLPGLPRWQILDTGWSIGWVAIALAGYNFLRWWLTLRPLPRRDEPREQPPAASREYHPEFDFTKDERPKNESNP